MVSKKGHTHLSTFRLTSFGRYDMTPTFSRSTVSHLSPVPWDRDVFRKEVFVGGRLTERVSVSNLPVLGCMNDVGEKRRFVSTPENKFS